VAAGKGKRAQRSGLDVPKTLAPVLGTPSILHVIRNIRTALPKGQSPTVIVSAETESEVTDGAGR